jgi:dynein heavy chain
MMSVGFFDKLKTFKKDEVPERVVKSMDKFLLENPDYTPDNVKTASKACYSLCKWCLAI